MKNTKLPANHPANVIARQINADDKKKRKEDVRRLSGSQTQGPSEGEKVFFDVFGGWNKSKPTNQASTGDQIVYPLKSLSGNNPKR